MTALDLMILGLSGARLPEKFFIPFAKHIHVEPRRGAKTYASVAVLWDTQGGTPIECVHELCTNRTIWVCIGRPPDLVHVCTFYSPPADGSDEKEVEWGDVLDSISRGINHIKRTVSRGALNKPTFVIQGDANMQPYALGRGPDPLPLRNTHWDHFLVSHGLRLLNPCMHDGVEHEIRIPYSGKTIKIALGDTHHGIGKSRAIDLIAISDDRPAETTIHNGIHCQAGSICQWEHCVGYARSDHFLASTSLRKRVSDGSLTTAATSFPIS